MAGDERAVDLNANLATACFPSMLISETGIRRNLHSLPRNVFERRARGVPATKRCISGHKSPRLSKHLKTIGGMGTLSGLVVFSQQAYWSRARLAHFLAVSSSSCAVPQMHLGRDSNKLNLISSTRTRLLCPCWYARKISDRFSADSSKVRCKMS